MERAFLEEQLAAGRSLEQIGAMVGRDASTVGYWVKKHGLTAVGREKHASRGGLSRQLLIELIDRGLSARQIAAECGVSFSTVRHWLKRYGLRTTRARQPRPAAEPRYATRTCGTHGPATFIRENRGYYRCTKCRAERVAARRRKVKKILVEEAGGRCVLCGYDRYVGALQFHHVDPTKKSFGIARNGSTRGIAEARLEVAKCVLVCGNCHAELEAGVATLRGRLAAAA
jgi:transcriptional regulator with XRE-family HTH domain